MEPQDIWEVYCHTSTVTGKSYVGLTKHSVRKRWRGHLEKVSNGSTSHFHNAIRKYGRDAWESKVLCSGITTLEEAEAAESRYIAEYDTFLNGYNLTTGGGCGVRGTRSMYRGSVHHCYGKQLSKEHAAKISSSNTGKVRSAESRRNISAGRLAATTCAVCNFYNPTTEVVERGVTPGGLVAKYGITSFNEVYLLAARTGSLHRSNGASYSASGWYRFVDNVDEVVVETLYNFTNVETGVSHCGVSIPYMAKRYGNRRKFSRLTYGDTKVTKEGWKIDE